MNNVIKLMLICMLSLLSCGEDTLPKQKGFLRLSYPNPKYNSERSDCPYTFEKNEIANYEPISGKNRCWYNLKYSKLKATLYLTYFEVNNNLDSLLRDAQNLTQEHVVKADAIKSEAYIDSKNNTYGMFYEVSGNAASQFQFYVTDSIQHFVLGSVYFKVRPNYDSILPAANYLRKDVEHLVESIRWEKQMLN